MPTCYPPLTIDPDSIDFNAGESGFTSAYIVPDVSCQPAECSLPPLIVNDLVVGGTLTSPLGGCKYTFESIFPSPPIYIPKPIIPIPPCPQGVTIETAVTFTGTNGATVTGGISVIGGPCNYLIGGIVNVDVPPVPCPNGVSFSTQTGGTGPLSIVGGPCNFALVGNTSGASGGGGNDVAAACLDCTATCCDVRTNIEAQYTTLSTTPQQGDIINVCVAVYEVVGTPNPTSTCDGTCPLIGITQVIDFTISSIIYYARLISTSCGTYPPYFCYNGGSGLIVVTPGTHNSVTATGSPLTVADGTGKVYTQVDFTYDAGTGVITISDNLLNTTTGSVPSSTISGGSGTLYQPLCSYTTSSGISFCSPLIGGSQMFNVCFDGPSISGPWGV